jgi:hypothetical protein
MALRAKWQFMDWSVTHKIVYGTQLRFGPYNILWVTSRSINCHMALSAMNYLLNILIYHYYKTVQAQVKSSWKSFNSNQLFQTFINHKLKYVFRLKIHGMNFKKY